MFVLWWPIIHSRWHVHECSGVDWEHEHRAGWQQEAVSYEWWNHSNDHSDEPHLWGWTSTPTPGQPEETIYTVKMLFFTSTYPSPQSLYVFSVWAARRTSFSRLVSTHIEFLVNFATESFLNFKKIKSLRTTKYIWPMIQVPSSTPLKLKKT